MRRFAFVLEQTLGHVAHARNIERALSDDRSIEPTIIRLDYRRPRGVGRLPGLRTWTFAASLEARAALRRRLREGPLDAAFIHTQVASLLCRGFMRSVPTVVSLDATPANFDAQGDAYGHRRSAEVVESVKRRLNHRVLCQASALVCWCRWAAASLVADYGVPEARIRVIPPGVDTRLFRPASRRGDGPVRVLFVGGDFERKGGPELLAAMRRLDDRAELDVVTGTEVPTTGSGVTCRVHRGLGPQAPELVRLYREADLFVLPSRGDCMPQAVAEAMACGLPVVATRVGAIPEMVVDGDNGYLVPPRDAGRLAMAIEALVADSGRRTAFGRRSLGLATQQHDAARNNRSIFELLADVSRPMAPLRESRELLPWRP